MGAGLYQRMVERHRPVDIHDNGQAAPLCRETKRHDEFRPPIVDQNAVGIGHERIDNFGNDLEQFRIAVRDNGALARVI